MTRMNCIYCSRPLDKSNEHIIPDSMNGRLQSTNIICADCNNKFGRYVDPVFKEMLNPLLIVFGFENARHTHAEGLDNETYNFSKDGKPSYLKNEVTISQEDNKTILRAAGNPKEALKAFQKQAKKLNESGKVFTGDITVENIAEYNSFRIKWEMKVNSKLILALNKIATEFYAHCELDTSLIIDLLSRIRGLDESIDNVTFCNWNCEVRKYAEDEVTHLIVLRKNKDNTLYCYLELFNVICVAIPLCNNYESQADFVYYQNALTGEKLTKEIIFETEVEFTNNRVGNFDLLINAACERHNQIKFREIYTEETKKILEQYKLDMEQGVIPANDEKFVLEKRLGAMIAQLSIDFPYMIEDYKDEMNDDMNHIHSNLREDQYDDFCEKYKFLIGKNVKIGNDFFVFDSFVKSPFIIRNSIQLLKVHFCLTNIKTNKPKYYPYEEFLRMLSNAADKLKQEDPPAN